MGRLIQKGDTVWLVGTTLRGKVLECNVVYQGTTGLFLVLWDDGSWGVSPWTDLTTYQPEPLPGQEVDDGR